MNAPFGFPVASLVAAIFSLAAPKMPSQPPSMVVGR